MATTTTVAKTTSSYLNGLLYGVKWVGTVSFSFTDSASDYEANYGNNEPLTNFAQVSVADMQAMRAVLLGQPATGAGGNAVMHGMGVANFTLLDIVDAGTNGADIRIGQSSKPGTSYAYMPSGGVGGDVWIGTAYAGTSNDYRNPVLGNYAYLTLAHELGHALGLKHAQEAGGVAGVAVPADRDDLEFTIMSYRSYIGGPTSGYTFDQWSAPQGFMMLDIAALQQMYGANFAYRSGDNTYGWNAQTGELLVDGVGQGQPGGNKVFETLWDGGGHDTYDLANYTTNLAVDLAPGGWSTLSAAQLANLGNGHLARANVFNAMLYNGNTASLVEDVKGGSGNDTILGNQADNHLWGNGGNDSLVGGLGADTLVGGAGLNTLYGGAGDDIYVVANAADVVREDANAGIDMVLASASLVLAANVENLVLAGSTDLNGTGNTLANRITGNAGSNILDGGGGADTLAGGAGDDIYLINALGVVVQEAAGEGVDLVRAGISCVLADNVENLTLLGTAALAGTGNALDNVILGNAGANSLSGGLGQDSLDGGAGNDTLAGGDGTNTLAGGLGNDTYIISSLTDVVREDASAGTDLVLATVSHALAANVENLTLTGSADLVGTGNALANVILGNGGNNLLSGLDGNDSLTAGAGNDTLDGGAGNDSMAGGLGNDTYVVDSATDLVSEAASAGTDLVLAAISHTLAANVENLTLTGAGNLNGTGNALANLLTGNGGNNLLAGGAGLDTLLGGAGLDTLLGGAGADVLAGGDGADSFRFASSGEGLDSILDFAGGSDRFEFSAAGFGGGLAQGMNLLTTGHLAINSAGSAVGSAAQFIFSTTTHVLSWDSNGSGAGGLVALAQVQDTASLSASDFFVIA